MGGSVKPQQTGITPLVREMATFAEDPAHWWIRYPGMPPKLQGHFRPMDYVAERDDLIFMVRVDFHPDPNINLVERRMEISSEKYKAHEIPISVLDEAKRAFFGDAVPSVGGWHSPEGMEWWVFRSEWEMPKGLTPVVINPQTVELGAN